MVPIKRIYWIALLICIILALALSVHLSTTTRDFSRYTIQWNGTSLFFSTIHENQIPEVSTPSQILSGSCRLLVVIAPEKNLSSADIAVYREYLAQGNGLVIADDFGGGNELLGGIDSSVIILQENLSSIDIAYTTPTSVLAYRFADHPLVTNVSSMVLNHPAAIRGGEPLMVTSILSWLDLDGNGRIDRNETVQRYPVLTHERLSGGDLYVLSDPSIFINCMVMNGEMRDNGRFIANLISSRDVCIDQMVSRTAEGDGPIELIVLVKSTYLIMIAIVGIAVLVLGVAWWQGKVVR